MNPTPLTFADEPLLGDGLLAYVATLGLLERLQLEGVCVDALQLLGLRRDRKRDGDVELEPKETVLGFVGGEGGGGRVGGSGPQAPVSADRGHLRLRYILFSFIYFTSECDLDLKNGHICLLKAGI